MDYFRKRLASFGYAFKGIATLFRTQANAQIHLLAIIAVVVLAYACSCSPTEWAILTLTMGSVLVAESFNTALEFLTDLVSPDYHELAGKAKDVAAAGVLFTAIVAVAVAIFIFLPKIILIIQ
ncbi:MAG TPA: diacylglycerol kinase family protein [Saprospiraceae bacterium]|nr:diacylglycerol kinase family protein [Saprospiraceae bacterium]